MIISCIALLINRVLGNQHNILYKVSFLLVTWILFLMIIFLLQATKRQLKKFEQYWFKILDIWKFHIIALRWRDEIRRSSQLRTLLKRVVVNRTWKKFRPVRDLNPWPLRYWCSALPIELASQLGAGNELGTNKHPSEWRF